MDNSIDTCPVCGLTQRVELVQQGTVAECSRCGTPLSRLDDKSLDRAAALSLAALLLYVPANIYPIMRMEFYGIYRESTVWDGCVRLFEDGQWLVAIIVVLASLVIPLLKLLGLFFLVISTKLQSQRFQTARMRIHKIIELAGPWAMLDVFLLAILVALVKMGRVATVIPGPGLMAFALVVVLTIFASASFDPRQIWKRSPAS